VEKRVGYILGGTVLGVFVVVALLVTATATRAAPLQAAAPTPALEASQVCVDCHRAQMPKG
jgi:cytochrome c553